MYVNGDIPENVHYHRIDSEVFIQQISVFAFHRLHLTDAFSASIRMESNIHSDGKRSRKMEIDLNDLYWSDRKCDYSHCERIPLM